jgi:uncharacterized membrane protein YqhA
MTMLNEHEKRFLSYWETRRQRETRIWFQVISGIPIGLLFALPILAVLFTARFWFVRADMVALSKSDPTVLAIGIVAIALFMGAFYRRMQVEKREQYYQELKSRED